MRPVIILSALVLLVPLAAAAPLPPVPATVDADAEGGSAQVTVERATLVAHARASPEAGEPVASAEFWRAGEDALGEEVVSLEVGKSFFAGLHSTPAGHDVRAGASSPWRSAHAAYQGDVAGHAVVVKAGTFHTLGQRFGYYDARVDGEGSGEFGSIPGIV